MSDFKIGDKVCIRDYEGYGVVTQTDITPTDLKQHCCVKNSNGDGYWYRSDLLIDYEEHQEAMDGIAEIEAKKDELYNFCQKLENMKAWDVDAVEIVKELGRIWDK